MAKQMPEGQKRTGAIMEVVNQVAQTDPQQAMTLAQQLPEGQSRNNAIASVIGQIAQTGQPAGFGELVVVETRQPGPGGVLGCKIARGCDTTAGTRKDGDGQPRVFLKSRQNRRRFIGRPVIHDDEFHRRAPSRSLLEEAAEGALKQKRTAACS